MKNRPGVYLSPDGEWLVVIDGPTEKLLLPEIYWDGGNDNKGHQKFLSKVTK